METEVKNDVVTVETDHGWVTTAVLAYQKHKHETEEVERAEEEKVTVQMAEAFAEQLQDKLGLTVEIPPGTTMIRVDDYLISHPSWYTLNIHLTCTRCLRPTLERRIDNKLGLGAVLSEPASGVCSDCMNQEYDEKEASRLHAREAHNVVTPLEKLGMALIEYIKAADYGDV